MLRLIDLTRPDEVCKPEMPGYVLGGQEVFIPVAFFYDYLGVCVAEMHSETLSGYNNISCFF